MPNLSPLASPASRTDWRRDLLASLLLLAVTFLAYGPALLGDFVWNDRDYVTKEALRSLAGLGRIWTDPSSTEQYYPLLHSFFWLQHRLWGDQALGYHLVTVALHGTAAVLFALLLRQLRSPGAWIAAALFALHPVHVESVAWIAEQKNTLSLVAYLLAARWYLKFDATRRPAVYAAALAAFIVSLACKTVTATLPAALLVVFWWQRGRLEWRRDVRPLAPWLLLGLMWGLFSGWVERHYGAATGGAFDLPLLERTLVAGRAFWFYFGHLVWPANLNFVYPRWSPDGAVWSQWLFPLAGLALAGGLWFLRGRSRTPLAVLLLFAGSLFPVLGFVNLYGALYSYVWDHWQYLPDLAPLALAGAAVGLGYQRLSARWRPIGGALLALLLAGAGAMTWRHCGLFRDEETLYRETLKRNPGCWMATHNLAVLLNNRPEGRPEAIRLLRETLRLQAGYAPTHYQLALALSDVPAQHGEALAQFQEALRLMPDAPLIHHDFAVLLRTIPGRLDEARQHAEIAARGLPNRAEVHNNLGIILAQDRDRLPAAIEEFQLALALKPDDAEAHNNLGNALSHLPARLGEALAEFEAALRVQPQFPEVHFNRGNTLARWSGRQAEASAAFEAALAQRPNYPEAHLNLGILLAGMPGRRDDAIAHFLAVLRLDPTSFEAHFDLGCVLLQYPDREEEAVAHLRDALRLRPDFTPARELLARLRAAEQ